MCCSLFMRRLIPLTLRKSVSLQGASTPADGVQKINEQGGVFVVFGASCEFCHLLSQVTFCHPCFYIVWGQFHIRYLIIRWDVPLLSHVNWSLGEVKDISECAKLSKGFLKHQHGVWSLCWLPGNCDANKWTLFRSDRGGLVVQPCGQSLL